MGWGAPYVRALREEPALRAYLLASLVDDVGVAVSVWAQQWMLTEGFKDQRARASFMVPMLLCYLAGSVVAGPLADWSGPARRRSLARWRWRAILAGRGAETVALGIVTAMLACAKSPGLSLILPYFVVSAMTKTGLRPTRVAFEVDLLRRESLRVDDRRRALVDEHGRPLLYKDHLLALTSLTSTLRVLSMLVGLLIGGWLLTAARGDIWKLFAADVLTSVLYLGVVGGACRPPPVDRDRPTTAARRFGARLAGDFRAVVRFLAAVEQRPLLCLLFGGWIVEVMTEFYDGRMIVRHELGGTEEQVRHAQIAWSLVSLAAMIALPLVLRRLDRLGRVFLAAMLLDGVAVGAAGWVASGQAPSAIVPFASALCVDRGLTDASGALLSVAQNSASGPELRGRIMAVYALVVLVSDVLAEGLATAASEAFGIPRMLLGLGLAQLVLVGLIAVLGGRRLWAYGVRIR